MDFFESFAKYVMTLIDRKQDKYKNDSYENSFIFTPRVHFDKYS